MLHRIATIEMWVVQAEGKPTQYAIMREKGGGHGVSVSRVDPTAAAGISLIGVADFLSRESAEQAIEKWEA